MLAYIPGFHQTAFQKWKSMDFAGGSVVKTLSFQCRGTGLIPGPGTKIPHAVQHRQKKKKKKNNAKKIHIYSSRLLSVRKGDGGD